MSRLLIDVERERAERRRERADRSRRVVSGVGVIAFISDRGDWGRIRTQTGELFVGDDAGIDVWRLRVGQKVSFCVGYDSRGRRQARSVRVLM
jgi:hypothetical protein